MSPPFYFLILLSLNFVKLGDCAYGGHDLFTSLSQLEELWKNEIKAVEKMKKVVENMDVIKESLQK